jgi:hypothetical protein
MIFAVNGVADPATVHWPGEGCFLSLAVNAFYPTLEVGQ